MVSPTYYRRVTLFGLTTAFGLIGTASARLRHQYDAVTPSAEEPSSPSSSQLFDNVEEHDDDADELPPLAMPHETVSLIEQQFSEDPFAGRDRMEMIRNGLLGLTSIRTAPHSFAIPEDGMADDGIYTDVYGEFCVYDATLNKQDPATYPTIHSVMGKSDHCGEHRYTMNLQDVMSAVNSHDDSRSSDMKRLPVSGLLFHEGYSGAGLISNALATFDNTHVISEHPAIRDALSVCDDIRNHHKDISCSQLKQQKLVQDVITLLSRTSTDSGLDHLYLKLPSGTSAYLHELRTLYPQAAWAFVYRNSDHALAKVTQHKRNVPCIKTRRNPSNNLVEKATEFNVDLEQLSNHEVCALHLSTLLDAAFKEHDQSGTGKLISYDNILLQENAKDALVNDVLPYLGLSSEIQADPRRVQEHVSNVLSMKSKAGTASTRQEDKQWNGEDGIQVSEEVALASKTFMSDSMKNIMRM